MPITIKLSNHEQIKENLDKFSQKLPGGKVDDILVAAAIPICEEARSLAPARTGRGKKAIKIGKPRTDRRGRFVTAGIHSEDHDVVSCYRVGFGISGFQHFLDEAIQKELALGKIPK
ncbi:MAG: hypothetical protein LBC56_04815 [Oscillospiraceae bacterium]|jgi:hypothetical protein|nr:hypothetical protein [Oscillospiraceae bacterium]